MVQPVSEIIDNGEGKRPVIVTFQNSELQEGEESKLCSGIYKDKQSKKTVVAVATKSILYSGEVTKDKDDLYNRFILASNRRTGKVRLIAVDTAILAPQINSQKKSITDSAHDRDVSMRQLHKEFGSKKIKRITEQRERLKMNIEDVKEHLEKTVAGIEVNESESFVVDNAENESIYRPPINRNAATKEEVYKLNEIVPENVLDSLEDEATEVLSSDLNEIELSSFIKEKLHELQDSSNDNVLETAKLLLYIDYLIKYIARPARNVTKKLIICQSSVEVNSHILDNFSVMSNSGRTRPLSMRDKTICNILVLTMIAFGYQIDIEKIAKTVKLGLKKLQEMGRVLAFSSHAKDKNVMQLKIPLPPAVSTTPRKRRR